VGIVGTIRRQADGLPQMKPVPLGPNIHLWQPAMKKSQPSWGIVSASAPSPCTPSTHSRMRSGSLRLAFTFASASARARTGYFTPETEYTHVTAM